MPKAEDVRRRQGAKGKQSKPEQRTCKSKDPLAAWNSLHIINARCEQEEAGLERSKRRRCHRDDMVDVACHNDNAQLSIQF